MAETIGAIAIEAIFAAAAAEGAAVVASTAVIGSITVGTLVGSAILLGASVGIAMLTSPSLAKPGVPDPSEGTQTLKQAIPPRLFGYGLARIAGAYMFFEAKDGSGDSYDVIALHHGPIGAIRYIYLHDDLVTLSDGTPPPIWWIINPDWDDAVSSVAGVSDLRYRNVVHIQFRFGEVTETAYGDVVTAFPALWTSAHRGDGIASAMIRCQGVDIDNYWKYYPHGLPKLSVVAELTKVFDPRDAEQDRDDPTTWTSSRNPVLQILDFLTSADHGMGIDWDTLVAPVLTDLMAEADACDERVLKWDASDEPRYEAGGFAYMTTDPVNVLQAILASCDGWMAEGADGTLRLVVGKYRAPTVTLTDDHIYGFSIDHGVADEEAVNRIEIVYAPAANDYREGPGKPWNETVDQAERGRVRAQQLSLTWVHSHSQARRLAKRQAARYLAPLRGTLTTSLYGLKARGQRWVRVQSSVIADLSDAVIEITRLRIDLTGARVVMDWTIVNPNTIDAWDHEVDDVTPPTFPGKLSGLELPVPENVVVHWSGGGAPNGLHVSWDDTGRPDLSYVVTWNYGGGQQLSQEFAMPAGDGQRITVTIPNRDPDYYPIHLGEPVVVGAKSPLGVAGPNSSPVYVS